MCTRTCVHAHMHTCSHTHTHTHTQVRAMHTHSYTHMCMHIHIYIHGHTCTHIYTYVHTNAHTFITHVHAYTCTYICARACIHTHTHTHTHTPHPSTGYKSIPSFNLFCGEGRVRDRISLYSPGCLGTHSVDQADLKLRNLPASASQVLGLKGCTTTAHCYSPIIWRHFFSRDFFLSGNSS